MHDHRSAPLYRPLASSVSLGWEGVVVEHLLHPPGTASSRPGADLMVCMALSLGPGPVTQTRHGRRHTGFFSRGMSLVMAPGSAGTWSHDSPVEHTMVFLPRAALVRAGRDLVPGDPEDVEVADQFQTQDEGVEHLCLALLAELQAGGSSGRLYRDSLAQALASRLVRLFATRPVREPRRPSDPVFWGRILDYIEAHLDRDLGLDELAAEAGVSRNHFVTIFSKALGTPPHRYLLDRRIARARTLLAASARPVSEIAAATGFYDQSHLARHLRRSLGLSPTDLRNRKNVL